MNGSYFIQAIIHVFKKMANEKSFMEMMLEVIVETTHFTKFEVLNILEHHILFVLLKFFFIRGSLMSLF